MIFLRNDYGRDVAAQHQARRWLALAVTAMALSALLAILLVVARTPGLPGATPIRDAFQTVLVLHVNFSLLVWLLSLGGVLWALAQRGTTLLDSAALVLALGGGLLMAIAPLTGEALPILSNYIPLLDAPLFFAGLSSFALAVTLQAVRGVAAPFAGVELRLAAIAWFGVVMIVIIHLLHQLTAHPLDYEQLFWGGGHLLQFVYLLLLIEVWQRMVGEGVAVAAMVAVAAVVVALLLAFAIDPAEAASRTGYTLLMQIGTPLLLLPVMWRVVPALRRIRDPALTASVVLMSAGMVIGVAITVDTVTVTAHYHATNAALTVAFMGYAYRLLPQLGYATVSPALVRWQLRLYALGMVLYVAGMAGSGWLGVVRKSAVEIVDEPARLAMGVMGAGGLLSVTATLLFVSLMGSVMLRRSGAAIPKSMGELL